MSEQSRITNMHIGRVYNLGNYENMRVEVTVEVGTEDDPARLLRSVEHILKDLRADAGVSEWDLSRARRIVAKPESELDEDDAKRLESSREIILKVEAAMQRRRDARDALSTLNYTSTYRDAKDDWDDEDY